MNSIIEQDLELICNNGLDWKQFKNSVVLISGGYGMLASYMVLTLLWLNRLYPFLNVKVAIICRNTKKARKKFGNLLDNPALKLIKRDVSKSLKISGKIDYIIHAASPASSQFYGVNPVSVISPNVFGTKNLLELAREKKSRAFLFFSSGEACGKVKKKIIKETDFGFLDPLDLRSCYGESKRMGENMCKCWHYQYGVPAVIVRPEHTYGPTMDLDGDKRVFSEFVSNVVNDNNIIIKSDGTAKRTFCYIADATDGFFRALLSGRAGEAYNIGNLKGQVSVGELAELLASVLPEKKLKVVYQGKRDDNYLENKNKIHSILSTEKIEKLGYKCRFDVRDGFYRTIKSFIQ